MPFAIKPQENILYPVPYAENEAHPLIITNLRVVQRSSAGEAELDAREIHFVGRNTVRPRLPLGAMLLALAVPLFLFAAYNLYTVWGMTAASPLSLFPSADSTATAAAPEEATDWPRRVLVTRLTSLGCALIAVGCALGARRLIRKKRYFVLCRAARRLVRIESKDEIQQTQIMVTLGAVKGKSLG